MGLFKKSFFGKKSKKDALAKAYEMQMRAKNKFINMLVNKLSDDDPKERISCANIIINEVVPALSLDKLPHSREASLETLKKLVTELRPPSNEEEMADFDNAVHYYIIAQIKKYSE